MRTLIIALTAALLALPAAAADRVTLPPQLLGTWCPVPSKRVGSATFYERGDCYHNNDGWITMGPDGGFDGHNIGCTTVKSTRVRRKHDNVNVYTLLYHCSGDAETWTENKNIISLDVNSMLMRDEEPVPSAKRRLPKEFVGEWCIVSRGDMNDSNDTTTIYRRGRCANNDDKTVLRSDGFGACKVLLADAVPKNNNYLVKFQCDDSGEPYIVNYWMSLDKRRLQMNETEREPG
jgi:hypothetical protein